MRGLDLGADLSELAKPSKDKSHRCLNLRTADCTCTSRVLQFAVVHCTHADQTHSLALTFTYLEGFLAFGPQVGYCTVNDGGTSCKLYKQ